MTRPANALAAKLSRSKVSTSDLEERLARAEAEISAVAEGFAGWAAQDLAAAQAEVNRLERAEGGLESVKTIFRIVHDIKGQGGTFGYNLLTVIAAPLCDYLRDATKVPAGAQLDVIKGHLMALEVVVKKDIRGDGDEAVRSLVDKLAVAIARVAPLG